MKETNVFIPHRFVGAAQRANIVVLWAAAVNTVRIPSQRGFKRSVTSGGPAGVTTAPSEYSHTNQTANRSRDATETFSEEEMLLNNGRAKRVILLFLVCEQGFFLA